MKALESDVEQLLKDGFNLNSYEARVYIALLRHAMSPKEVSSAAKVPLPRVYDTLRSLSEKGFIEALEGSYRSITPTAALEARMVQFRTSFEKEQLLRERAKKKIDQALRPIYSEREETIQEPVLLRGISSIGSKLLEIVKDSKDIIFLVRKAVEIKDTFKAYLESITIKNKRIRMIVPSDIQLSSSDTTFLGRLGIQLRLTANPILDIMVADNSDVIIGVPERSNDEPFSAIAIWLRNESFAKSIRRSLEEMWEDSQAA